LIVFGQAALFIPTTTSSSCLPEDSIDQAVFWLNPFTTGIGREMLFRRINGNLVIERLKTLP